MPRRFACHHACLLALSLPAVLACSGSVAPEPLGVSWSPSAAGSPEFSSVVRFLEGQMTSHAVPGASIAIVQNGLLAFSAGVGVKQAGGHEQVLPDTLFETGSLSEMVLAPTLLSLVDDGKVDVSRPVTDYVPLELASPFDPDTVTVQSLLTHTSGLPDLDLNHTSCPVGPGQTAAWFQRQPTQPLWTVPGEVWNFSNRGLAVLGWVVEAVSGNTYESVATSRVLGTAGMTTATFDLAAAREASPALGHALDPETNAVTVHSPGDVDCAVTRAPSGVIASAVDFAHLAEKLLANGGTTLPSASVASMESAHADTDWYPDGSERYGYGVYLFDGYKGLHVVRHTSQTSSGYRASIWVVPERQFAVVVFYNDNAEEASPDVVSKFAVDTFLGLTGVAAPDWQTPSSTWSSYVGIYDDPYELGTVEVSLAGDSLVVSVPQYGVTDLPLTQEAGDRFTATLAGESTTVTFYPGKSGPASWLVTRRGVAARR